MVYCKLLQSKNVRHAKYRIDDINLSIINSIRRIILSEIPNVAFNFNPYNRDVNDINIIQNNTVLNNEFLGHRLSMIPINLPVESIENFSKKAIKYKYVINKKNTTNDIMNVTTQDIVIYDENNNILSKEERDTIFPRNKETNNYILINRLKPDKYNVENGEEMNVEMSSTQDIAKTHARWSPVSTCTFINTVDDNLAKNRLEELLSNIESTNKSEIKKTKNLFESIEKYRMFKKNKFNEPCSFDFEIESECNMTPKYLLIKSLDILINKLRHIISEPNKYAIDILDEDTNMYSITFNNENHTFANLYQNLVYNNMVRKTNELKYIGYFSPHPLEERVVFKVVFSDKIKSIDMFLKHSITEIVEEIISIKKHIIAEI